MSIRHENDSKFSNTDKELEILAQFIYMISEGATIDEIENSYIESDESKANKSRFLATLELINNFNTINGEFITTEERNPEKYIIFKRIIENPDEKLILLKLIQLSPPITDDQIIKNSPRSGLLDKIPIDFGLNPIDALTYNTLI